MTCSMPFTPCIAQHMPPSAVALMDSWIFFLSACLGYRCTSPAFFISLSPAKVDDSKERLRESKEPALDTTRHAATEDHQASPQPVANQAGGPPGPGDGGRWGTRTEQYQPSTRLDSSDRGERERKGKSTAGVCVSCQSSDQTMCQKREDLVECLLLTLLYSTVEQIPLSRCALNCNCARH